MNKSSSKTNGLKRGILVFVALVVLTAIEFGLSIAHLPSALLWLVALLKAGLVLWFFMHLPLVFNPEGDHE